MIECALQPIALKYLPDVVKKQKYGMYLQAMYWDIKGYGKKKWLVAVKIGLDYSKAKEIYENDDDIVEKCIEYLNTPPKSKYGRRRKRKPLYVFAKTPYKYNIEEDDEGKKTISAKLITEEQKNKHFWKNGPLV